MLEINLGDDLPVSDWILGLDQDGVASFYAPLGVGILVEDLCHLFHSSQQKRQQRIKLFVVLWINDDAFWKVFHELHMCN